MELNTTEGLMYWYGKELKFHHGTRRDEWGNEIVLCRARKSATCAKTAATKALHHFIIEIRRVSNGTTTEKHRREFNGRWEEIPVIPDKLKDPDNEQPGLWDR